MLHSGKGRQGFGGYQTERDFQTCAVNQKASPTERFRLWAKFLLLPPQVNGRSVAGLQHSEVVAAIKAGGDETRLLVVDADTEDFFNKLNIVPTEEHVSGNARSARLL